MSINIVKDDLSLERIASDTSVTVKARELYMGKVDILFDGSINTGAVTLSNPYKNYDYIEFELTNSRWLAIQNLRFSSDIVGRSSSSNILRYYLNSNWYFQCYQTSGNQIYFSQNTLTLKRVVGYKMGTMDVTIKNPSAGDIYPYNTINEVQTKNIWVDGSIIFRKCAYKTLTSSISSDTTLEINNNMPCKDVVNCRGFIVTTAGNHIPLPYVDSSGYTSYKIDSTTGYITVVVSGQTWSSGTTFNFITDYTKK